MIPGEQFPTLLDVQQLEQAGFSGDRPTLWREPRGSDLYAAMSTC